MNSTGVTPRAFTCSQTTAGTTGMRRSLSCVTSARSVLRVTVLPLTDCTFPCTRCQLWVPLGAAAVALYIGFNPPTLGWYTHSLAVRS